MIKYHLWFPYCNTRVCLVLTHLFVPLASLVMLILFFVLLTDESGGEQGAYRWHYRFRGFCSEVWVEFRDSPQWKLANTNRLRFLKLFYSTGNNHITTEMHTITISFFSSVICHVVGITYQTIEHRLLAEMLGDPLGKNFYLPQSLSADSCKYVDTLSLFIQTLRWRSGWISTAGRRTRKVRSSSTTRRRASSPRTSSRRSTLRVSAAAQTDCRRVLCHIMMQ